MGLIYKNTAFLRTQRNGRSSSVFANAAKQAPPTSLRAKRSNPFFSPPFPLPLNYYYQHTKPRWTALSATPPRRDGGNPLDVLKSFPDEPSINTAHMSSRAQRSKRPPRLWEQSEAIHSFLLLSRFDQNGSLQAYMSQTKVDCFVAPLRTETGVYQTLVKIKIP